MGWKQMVAMRHLMPSVFLSCLYLSAPKPCYCNCFCLRWNEYYSEKSYIPYIFSPHGPESVSELYWPSYRRLSAKLMPAFEDRGCHMVSVTDPFCCILEFLDRSHYFQVAPQLYWRGPVGPVLDSLLLRKSGSAGNRTRTSKSVARNSDH
jgi:hypothetical protein